MRRILLVITDLLIGGTPTVVRELALRLHASGTYVEVACLAGWGPVADDLHRAGVRVTALNARASVAAPWIAWRLARLVRARQIDTLFSFLVHANVVAAAASLLCPLLRRLQSIQTTQPRPRWHWRAQALAARFADRIIVPSPSVERAAHDWARIPSDKVRVIPNAIDADAFAPRAIGERRFIEHARIGFIGRLDPVKRVTDLVAALPSLDAGAHLHIFGEGSDRANIEKAIARLGLRARVTLHGSIAAPLDALRQIDLLALPSEAEGFGLVLIEAMAAGVPVVATDVPGIRDVVRNGQTGLLVPVGSPDQLAAAVRTLLGDQDLRDAMIRRAQQDVRERFSWELVLPQYLAALDIT